MMGIMMQFGGRAFLGVGTPQNVILLGSMFFFGSPSSGLSQTASILADAAQFGPAMSRGQLGVNLLEVVPESHDSNYIPLLASTGIGLIRWPGGAPSDSYHWQTHSYSLCNQNSGNKPN